MNRPEYAPVEPTVVYPSAVTRATAEAGLARATAEALPAPLPGAELVIVPGVGRVWAYTDPRPPAAVTPQRGGEPLPMWVKAVALLMPSTACSVAVGAWGLSLAVGAFEAITSALWALTGATVAVGAVVGGVALVVRGARRGGGGTATATATATSRGLLGKATATATATVKR